MLYLDYYVYFLKLPASERVEQISILIIFLTIIVLAAVMSKFIKDKKRGN